MMFKISFFLTLALALSSLNAVTAVSVPRQEDDGGEGVLRFTDLSAPEPGIACIVQANYGNMVSTVYVQSYEIGISLCTRNIIVANKTGIYITLTIVRFIVVTDPNYDLFVPLVVLQAFQAYYQLPNTIPVTWTLLPPQ